MVFDDWLEPTPRGGVYLFHVSLERMIGFRREVIREPANWSSSRPDEDEARRAVAAFLKAELPAKFPTSPNSRIRRSHCFNCLAPVDSQRHDGCASCGWLRCAECGACGCSYDPPLRSDNGAFR